MNKQNPSYRSKIDICQYKLLWKLPCNLKTLALETDYTYISARQLCLRFEQQGLLHFSESHGGAMELTERGKTVLKLLDGIYKEIHV